MSKDYLESLERLAMPDELHIKECKKLGIGLTEDYNTVEKALQRLEAIDNANPSEAMKCLDKLFNDYKELCVDAGSNEHIYQECNLTSPYNTIKKYILKQQEPKQYLKWEDLKFTDERQTIKVLLNGEKYFVKYKKEYLFGYYEKVEITNGTFILCTLGSAMKQLFNDLHLERVEE